MATRTAGHSGERPGDAGRADPGRDGEPYRFYQWAATKPTPKSKSRPWVEALYGRPLVNGERPQET